MINDVFESNDSRDTDPVQPHGRRRIKVTKEIGTRNGSPMVETINLTTGRRSRVEASYLLHRRWKLIENRPGRPA